MRAPTKCKLSQALQEHQMDSRSIVGRPEVGCYLRAARKQTSGLNLKAAKKPEWKACESIQVNQGQLAAECKCRCSARLLDSDSDQTCEPEISAANQLR